MDEIASHFVNRIAPAFRRQSPQLGYIAWGRLDPVRQGREYAESGLQRYRALLLIDHIAIMHEGKRAANSYYYE